MKKNIVFVALLSLLFFAGCSTADNAGSSQSGPMKAPDFALQDINGKTIRIRDFENKVVILNFFATWCPPCRHEIPDFITLVNTKDKERFAVIGISVEKGDYDTVKKFVMNNRINYPVLVDDGIVSNAYGPIHSIPVTFIIDKDGNIAQKVIGSRSRAEFERMIDPLIKQ